VEREEKKLGEAAEGAGDADKAVVGEVHLPRRQAQDATLLESSGTLESARMQRERCTL